MPPSATPGATSSPAPSAREATREPDYWLIPAEEGDRILVCSDGLSGELDATRIHAILLAETDPQAAATRLVHEAMLRGGRDNITALVVDALAVRSARRSRGNAIRRRRPPPSPPRSTATRCRARWPRGGF